MYVHGSWKNPHCPPDLLPVPVEKRPLIKQAKYLNLMALLNYVPPIYHEFFRNLRNHGEHDVERPNLQEIGQELTDELDHNYETDIE